MWTWDNKRGFGSGLTVRYRYGPRYRHGCAAEVARPKLAKPQPEHPEPAVWDALPLPSGRRTGRVSRSALQFRTATRRTMPVRAAGTAWNSAWHTGIPRPRGADLGGTPHRPRKRRNLARCFRYAARSAVTRSRGRRRSLSPPTPTRTKTRARQLRWKLLLVVSK